VQVELVSRSQKAQSSVEKEAEVRNCHFLQAETARRKAASCEAAAYVSQGQVPIGTAPGSSLVKIPRTEGAQYSVASFAGSVIQGRDPRASLAALAHPGLLSAAAPGSLMRTSTLTLYLVGVIR